MRDYKEYTILDAAGSATTGSTINCADYKHAVISIATANSANFTLQFQGAISENAPDFSASQSVSNMWDYIEVADLEDGSLIDGDTGISAAGTDDHRLVELNVNALRQLCATITAYSAGNITVKVMLFNDQ